MGSTDSAPTSTPAASKPAGGIGLLWTIFRAYQWRILFTYLLFNVENVLRLVQPLALGLAINDLLLSPASFRGLGLLVTQHLSHLAIRSWRQMYDTRAFTSIYTDVAARLVVEQRQAEVEVSRVAARSALSREYVDFFERHVPIIVRSIYSVIGALVMLGVYDIVLVPYCLALAAPALLLNRFYGKKTLALNGRLHDEFEREVEVITRSQPDEVRDHYRNVARWRVKLSDWEAYNFGAMEFFILGLMAAALVRFCTLPGATAGDIFAVFRYVLMFIMGLDSVPMLVQQVSRLRDIGRRLPLLTGEGPDPAGPEGPDGPAPGGRRRGKRGKFPGSGLAPVP